MAEIRDEVQVKRDAVWTAIGAYSVRAFTEACATDGPYDGAMLRTPQHAKVQFALTDLETAVARKAKGELPCERTGVTANGMYVTCETIKIRIGRPSSEETQNAAVDREPWYCRTCEAREVAHD